MVEFAVRLVAFVVVFVVLAGVAAGRVGCAVVGPEVSIKHFDPSDLGCDEDEEKQIQPE